MDPLPASNDPLKLVANLEAAQAIQSKDLAQWTGVANAARVIADTLRVQNGPVDYHTRLGETKLPRTIGSLLSQSTKATPAAASATYELLRVGANLCSDHDENRQRLLEAGVIKTTLAILAAYWSRISQPSPVQLTVPDLRLVKTGIGFLLNSSVGYAPAQATLLSETAPLLFLRLSSALYPPGAWAKDESADIDNWRWRSGISAWSWKAIEILTATDEDDEDQRVPPEHGRTAVFDAQAVSAIASSLRSFVPPYPTNPPGTVPDKSDLQSLVNADLEALQQVSMLLETLSLDSEAVRVALASTSPTAPSHEPKPPLIHLVDFVERACPPWYWAACTESEKERERWEKMLSVCKAAIIKAIVTTASEDKNLTVLWDSTAKDFPGGWFVERMVTWIKEETTERPTQRDDLLICATLSLGNLARNGPHCMALLASPISLTPYLLPLVGPKVDIKIKHGSIGLLKHLAQPPPNKDILGVAGVIEALSQSGIWKREADMAEMVQMSAIGVAKHLAYSNASNALRLVNPIPSARDGDTPLDEILDLVKRSDTVALQSEGTRVLVNAVKGLFSFQQTGAKDTNATTSSIKDSQRGAAIAHICTLDSTEPLAEMLGRSGKFPILLHECVVALTLLSSHPSGLTCVTQALLAPLGYRISDAGLPRAPSSGTGDGDKESETTEASTSRPVDMLAFIIRNPDGKFQPELIANTCALLASLSPGSPEDLVKFKARLTGPLQALANAKDDAPGSSHITSAAAKKTLDLWK